MSNKALQWVKNIREAGRNDSYVLNLILDAQPVGVSLAGEEEPPVKVAPGLAQLEIEEILQGRYIVAIKELRSRTGLGLKESKDIIDAWRNKMAAWLVKPPEPGFSR